MRTIGYVCVHGIGVQESGDLAAEVLSATELGAVEVGGSLIPVPYDQTAPLELKHRAVVSIPGEESFLAEFYDGWWDRRVPRPGFWPVLFWALLIAPFAILNAAGHWTDDRAQDQQSSEAREFLVNATAIGLAGLALGGPALLTTFSLLALLRPHALTAGIPVLLVAFFLLLLPVLFAVGHSRTREKIRSHIVDVIGDAWLYRSEELENEVIPHLESISRSAQSRADVVVLIGHSQGAELTRRVALGEASDRCVWLGSGENQLSMVRTLAKSRIWHFAVWPILLSWPLLVYFIVMWGFRFLWSFLTRIWEMLTGLLAQPSHPDEMLSSLSEDLWPIFFQNAANMGKILVLVITYVGMGCFLRRWFLRSPTDVAITPKTPIWAVKSPIDPVSFGPSHSTAEARYVPLHPKKPWYKEHVTYFEKPATGMVILEAGLKNPRPLAPTQPPRIPAGVLAIGSVLGIAVLAGTWLLGRLQADLLFS